MKMKRTKVKSAGSNDKHSKPSKKLKTGITSDDEKLSDKGKSKEASNSSGKKKPGKKGKVAELNSPVTTSERRKGKSPIDYKGTKIISPVDLKKKTIEKTSQKASQKTVQKEVNVKKRDPLHPITCVMGLQCKTITDAQVKKVNSSDQNPQKDVEAETPQPAAPLKPKLTGQSAPLKPKLTGQSAPLTRKLTGHSAPLKPKLTGQSAPLSPKLTGQSAPLSPKLTGNSEVNESDTVISLKRKRGRPAAKKKRVAPVKVNNENGDAKGKEVVLVGSPKSSEAKKTTKPVETAVVSVEKTSPLQQEKPKSVKGKRGKRRKISSITVGSSPKDLTKNDVGNVSRSLNEGMLMYHRRTSPPVNGNAHSDDTGSRSGLSTSIAHLTRDRESSWKQKPNGTTEKDSQTPPVEKSLDTISDDQPLSRWIEGILPTTTTTAVTKKPTETPKPKPPPSFPKGQNQPLSFEKRSTLWSTLELMPLFKQIPQNPHFHPLNTEKECTREGQAISKMVTFFRVVEATSQLNIENPKSLIEDNLEALMELEPHGFDVKAVKDRLAKLLILKGKKEKLEEQSRKLKEKMEVEKNEGQKIDKEIELVEKQVVSLLEKRAQVLAKKEKKDLEVGKLEAEVDGVKMGISETREKFVGLVGAEFVSKNL